LHLTKLLREARKNGAKLVVIDPKRIRIARDADLHLPILPGTDVVLAYAVAAELDRQNALDDNFIARHVSGAGSYLEEAKKYSLQRAASLCGLAVEDIRQFVAYWRDIRPAAISIGVAPERNRNGGAGIRAAFALPALTGNFGFPGAGVCDVSGFFSVDKKALRHPEFIPPGTREMSVLDIPQKILEPGDDIPIESVFIYNHNPIAVHPRQRDMQRALLKDDVFVVGSDITMTDSMACADIILPAATHLEYGDLYKAYGHHYLQRSEPVIPPVGESLPNTELFRVLAARFGFNEPCFTQDDNDLIKLAMVPGGLPDGLSSAAEIDADAALDMAVGNTMSMLRGAPPATPSGKIELYSEALEHEYGQGLPQYRALESNRRFILVSPSSDKRTNSTFGGVAGHDSDLMVEMNPEDARSLALHDGESVRLYNDLGNVMLPLKISSDVRPSTVYVPKGAWLKNSKTGQTINALIPGHRADIAGGACYNDAMVDVEAATF
jgi:anaerobic selenocysteine-containing dehydrogenase